MSRFEERRVIYYHDVPSRNGLLSPDQFEIKRTFPNFTSGRYLTGSNEYLFDRTVTVSTYKNHQPIIHSSQMYASLSPSNYHSYQLGKFSSQFSREYSVRDNSDYKVTFTPSYGNTQLKYTTRNAHFNSRTAGGRPRPYYNMHCNLTRAKKIAKRLKNAEDFEEAVDDLCFIMNVKNRQPLKAVMKELHLLLEECNQKQCRRNNVEKSTQTINTHRQLVKKEFCTPIPEGFLRNIMETPKLPTKMSVKLEKITPRYE